MKPDAMVLLLACVGYTACLALFNIGGEQLPTVAYGVAFVAMLLLGGITLAMRELGGESA